MRGVLHLGGWSPHCVRPGFIVTCITSGCTPHRVQTSCALSTHCRLCWAWHKVVFHKCFRNFTELSLQLGSGILYMTGTHSSVGKSFPSSWPSQKCIPWRRAGVIGPSPQALLITGLSQPVNSPRTPEPPAPPQQTGSRLCCFSLPLIPSFHSY